MVLSEPVSLKRKDENTKTRKHPKGFRVRCGVQWNKNLENFISIGRISSLSPLLSLPDSAQLRILWTEHFGTFISPFSPHSIIIR